jgi:uncharacterized damage-inducible protein DinB
MAKIELILHKLESSRRGLLSAADAVSSEHWQTPPGQGRWCAAQLVAHLGLVERFILRKADRMTQGQPETRRLLERVHLPLVIVEKGWFRRKSPAPVTPSEVGRKEEMLADLREARERTLAFLDETKGRDLSGYCWPHPFLGTLSAYDWLRFIASHEIRHTKQMREIAASLPKSVANLPN